MYFRRSLLNEGSAVSLSVPLKRWAKPLEATLLFFWNSIWIKIQQSVARAEAERSTIFLQKAYDTPLFSSQKSPKSTILKTPKIHSGFLRCAKQLLLTDNSDTLLRCVNFTNTCERVSEQFCWAKKVTLLLLFWFYLRKRKILWKHQSTPDSLRIL